MRERLRRVEKDRELLGIEYIVLLHPGRWLYLGKIVEIGRATRPTSAVMPLARGQQGSD